MNTRKLEKIMLFGSFTIPILEVVAIALGMCEIMSIRLVVTCVLIGTILAFSLCYGALTLYDIRRDKGEIMKTKRLKIMDYEITPKKGFVIKVDGKMGVINKWDGRRVYVKFSGIKHSVPCHPLWETVYYDEFGNVTHDFRE